jgi:hypothetical protein
LFIIVLINRGELLMKPEIIINEKGMMKMMEVIRGEMK